jgi:hypothetical protein
MPGAAWSNSPTTSAAGKQPRRTQQIREQARSQGIEVVTRRRISGELAAR